MNAIILIALFLLIIMSIGVLRVKVNVVNAGKYISRKPLSIVEQQFYWKLVEACGDQKVVLSQVAFSSFIRVEGKGKNNFAKFGKARQKVADFMICNKDFSISKIIEIDDKSHKKEKDQARDLIGTEAGINTIRYEATKLPSVEELKEILK